MPYHNRKHLLINTIKSIQRFNSVNECEFIIVDEASSEEHQLKDIFTHFPNLNIHVYRFINRTGYCPVYVHNKSFELSKGEIIIIQNPEALHVGNVVQHAINNIKKNDYLVYAQYSLTEQNTQIVLNEIDAPIQLKNKIGDDLDGWYQHSIYRNNQYNFCSAILREDLLDLGGFDERYAHGAAFGDDEFITRIRRKGMNIMSIDNPYTYHQYHQQFKMYAPSNEALYRHTTCAETEYKVKTTFTK